MKWRIWITWWIINYIRYSRLFWIYIKKIHGEKTVNPSTKISINKIENRIIFRIKTGYYLQLLPPETMKLLGSTKRKLTKNENSDNVPNLEIIEVVLVHCNINNNYQQNSRVLYTFTPDESVGELLHILSKNFIFWKTYNSEFSYIEAWFTDQNSNPLEIDYKINISLVIN